MPSSRCACGRSGPLFGGSCLQCVGASRPRARHGDTGPSLSTTFERTRALRSKVEAKFLPLFDHLLSLAENSLKHGHPTGAGQELRRARKLAGEAAPMRAAPKSQRVSRTWLGEKMAPWGSDFSYGEGSGSVGAVSSFYISDEVYPDRTVVERAVRAIEEDIPKAERGEHGWTKRDAGQLRSIASGLRYFLRTDYKS